MGGYKEKGKEEKGIIVLLKTTKVMSLRHYLGTLLLSPNDARWRIKP